MSDPREDDLPVNRTPELSYLESIASVIINARTIRSAAFYLDYETEDPLVEPVVVFFGDPNFQKIGLSFAETLQILQGIRKNNAEEYTHTTPVRSVVTLPCDVATCIKEKGHVPEQHQNAEGTGWWGATPPKQSGRPGDPG